MEPNAPRGLLVSDCPDVQHVAAWVDTVQLETPCRIGRCTPGGCIKLHRRSRDRCFTRCGHDVTDHAAFVRRRLSCGGSGEAGHDGEDGAGTVARHHLRLRWVARRRKAPVTWRLGGLGGPPGDLAGLAIRLHNDGNHVGRTLYAGGVRAGSECGQNRLRLIR